MHLTCPTCHASINLEALLEGDAARSLFSTLIALDGSLGRALAAYLGFFRRGSLLSWDRALRLARDVLRLDPKHAYLELALTTTVEYMRVKRERPDWRPLQNHTYLKSVLSTLRKANEGVADAQVQAEVRKSIAAAPTPKVDDWTMTAEEWDKGKNRVKEIQANLGFLREEGTDG